MTGQDGKDCFGTAEILNSGRIKTDLELFEDAFKQSDMIQHLIQEYKTAAHDSEEWSDSSDSD